MTFLSRQKGDFNTAANGVINTTLSFVKAANRLKLPLATTDDKKTPRAVCVASSHKLCKYVTQQLALGNVSVAMLGSTRDVGVDHAGGKIKCKKTYP